MLSLGWFWSRTSPVTPLTHDLAADCLHGDLVSVPLLTVAVFCVTRRRPRAGSDPRARGGPAPHVRGLATHPHGRNGRHGAAQDAAVPHAGPCHVQGQESASDLASRRCLLVRIANLFCRLFPPFAQRLPRLLILIRCVHPACACAERHDGSVHADAAARDQRVRRLARRAHGLHHAAHHGRARLLAGLICD